SAWATRENVIRGPRRVVRNERRGGDSSWTGRLRTVRDFYDLEFGDTASVVSLVSVGVVAEDGREYYAVSSEFDPLTVHPWVADNVLPQLPPASTWNPRALIAKELEEFL